MEIKDALRKDFNEAYQVIQTNMTQSFEYIDSHPEESDEIIYLWTQYIKNIISDATRLSEEYNNNKFIKAITKTLIFGR